MILQTEGLLFSCPAWFGSGALFLIGAFDIAGIMTHVGHTLLMLTAMGTLMLTLMA